jgi:hypothetical protein
MGILDCTRRYLRRVVRFYREYAKLGRVPTRQFGRGEILLAGRDGMWNLTVLVLSLGFLLSCSSKTQTSERGTPNAQQISAPRPDPTLVRPETVRLESVVFIRGVKNLIVSNPEGKYTLACNSNVDTCLSLAPGKDYLLFNKATKWKFPGATEYATLDFFQDWTIKYNDAENIALIPTAEGQRMKIGMYWLVSWSKNK